MESSKNIWDSVLTFNFSQFISYGMTLQIEICERKTLDEQHKKLPKKTDIIRLQSIWKQKKPENQRHNYNDLTLNVRNKR